MRVIRTAVIVLGALACVATSPARDPNVRADPLPSTAAGPAAGDTDAAQRAFARIVSLEGAWLVSSGDDKPTPAKFIGVSQGKAVTQESGFFGVFARDGGTITLELYPATETFHATMRATANAADPDRLEFVTVDLRSYEATAGHPTSMRMLWNRDSELIQKWSWLNPDGNETSFDLVFTRASP